MIVSAEFCRGAGLGNKLFPWARARLFANEYACPHVQTRWLSMHGGAITRGGIDYAKAARKILLWHNFSPEPGSVPRLWASIRYADHKIKLYDSIESARVGREVGAKEHVMFRCDKRHDFLEFNGAQPSYWSRPRDIFFQELSIDRLQGMKNKAAVQRIVQSFGATSMAVFLVHPIITRVGSVVVNKYCAAPYSGMTIAVDWMLCWLLAFTFATIALKVPYCRRVVS